MWSHLHSQISQATESHRYNNGNNYIIKIQAILPTRNKNCIGEILPDSLQNERIWPSKVRKAMVNVTPLGFLLWLCKDYSFIKNIVLKFINLLILLLWKVKKKVMA